MVLTGVREPQGLEFRTGLSRHPSDGFRIHIPCLKEDFLAFLAL